MTIEHAVGRLFMIGFHGTEVTGELKEVIRQVRPGGVILFKRNVENPVQLAEMCAEMQRISLDVGAGPLFIAIDQEGGVVTRLAAPFRQFPSQGELKDAHYDDVFRRGAQMAEELTLVGINVNLAPVLDVRRPDDDTKNFWRSFSEDPHRTAMLGIGLIRGLQNNNVLACAKHFPGLGRARVDPHVELPTVDGDLEQELIPFIGAIAQDVAAVMMSHAVYPSLDPDWQASLSHAAIDGLLRKRLAYHGLVITDDLEMGAVSRKFTLPECSAHAFRAGSDILLICSKLEQIPDCHREVVAAVEGDPALRDRLNLSNMRIEEAKKRYLSDYRLPDMAEVKDYFARASV